MFLMRAVCETGYLNRFKKIVSKRLVKGGRAKPDIKEGLSKIRIFNCAGNLVVDLQFYPFVCEQRQLIAVASLQILVECVEGL